MQKRLFGLENEYAVHGLEEMSEASFFASFFKCLIAVADGYSLPYSGSKDFGDLWLANGARCYQDSTHPEYATPECESVYDLICHERAGDIILSQAFSDFTKLYPGKKFALLKNNFAPSSKLYPHHIYEVETFWGCHENYLVKEETWRRAKFLRPFFATRQILTGAGHIRPNSGQYVISGRSFYVQSLGFHDLSSGCNISFRDFFLMRSTPLDLDESQWRRLQITGAENNMLEFPLWLRFMTTHLCFRLVEEGWEPETELDPAVNFLGCLKDVSGDIFLKKAATYFSGKEQTAVDVQRYYLENTKRISTLSPDELKAIADWEWILNLLDQDLKREENLGQLYGILDWTTKLYLMQKVMRKNDLAFRSPKVRSMNLSYHILAGERFESIWLKLCQQDIKRVVKENDIKRALTNPPDSKSRLRADFIRFCHASRRNSSVANLGWGKANISLGSGRSTFGVDFGSSAPFGRTSPSLEKFKKLAVRP